MKLEDCVVHQMPGRIRLRVPSLKGNDAVFEQAQSWVSRFPGVTSVHANPLTASLLVLYDPAKEQDLFSAAQGLLGLLAPDEVQPPSRATQEWLDAQLGQLRDAYAQAAPLIALGLFGLGALQALRGQVLGPAATLFWYALRTLSLSQGAASAGPPPGP